jgi:hypothetical protein
MRKHITLLILTSLLCGVARPAEESPARTFGWLSGHWCMQVAGELTEELWLPNEGDIAVGVSRTVNAGKTKSVEFMRIELRDGVPNFVAVLEGQPPTPFRQTAAGRHWVRFENPQHDFPKRIEYRLDDGVLHAEVAGPGPDGKEKVIPYDYRRCVD